MTASGATAAGVGMAASGAVAYGVTIVIGRALAEARLGSGTALGARFGVAAIALAVVLRLRRAPLRPQRGEWLRIVTLGAVGYATESTLFFLALERGTAATTALLFYVYPALVVAIELARGRERLRGPTLAALGLSVAGTAVVVGAGGRIAISAVGAVCALASAATYAVYLLLGRELGRRSDAMTAACWVAAGASGSNLIRGLATGELRSPLGHIPALVVYGLATAAAFTLIFAALGRIGTARTAVISTLEAFAAVVLAAAFLDEPIGAAHVVGGAAIITAAAVLAWARSEEPASAPAAAAAPVLTGASAAPPP